MIRPVQIEDLDTIVRLEELCFEDPWNLKDFENDMNNNAFSNGIVWEVDGVIYGYAFFWTIFESSQLVNIAVDPEHRGQGIGKALLEECLRLCHEAGCENMTLEVRVSNEVAQKLYTSFGFVPLHRVRQYYKNGEDALLMGAGI